LRLLTIQEAADLLRLSNTTVRKMRCQGRLPGALRIGGRALFDQDVLEEFVRDQASQYAAKSSLPKRRTQIPAAE